MNQKGSIDNMPLRYCLTWLAIVVTYIVIRINIVDIPLDRDEGGWAYYGQQILRGEILYDDMIDHRGPVTSYLYSLAAFLFPPTAGGIHLFLHIYNFLTLIALFFFSKVFFSSNRIALWVAFVYAVFSSDPSIQGFTASNEMFTLLPIALNLLFSVLAVQRDRPYFFVLSGISGALACWTRTPAFFIVLFSLIYLLLFQLKKGTHKRLNWSTTVRSFLLWTAGSVGCSVLILFFFYYHGVMDNLIHNVFVLSVDYASEIRFVDALPIYIHRIFRIWKEHLFVAFAFAFALFMLVRNKDKKGYFLLGLLIASILTLFPFYAYPHYFAQLAPAVAVIAGFGISQMASCIQDRNRKVGFTRLNILLALLTIVVPVAMFPGYYFKQSPQEFHDSVFPFQFFPHSIKVAQYISEHTTPNDTIFILGTEPQILFYAQRRSATSGLVNIYPLMSESPWYKQFQEKIWQEILISRPKYIIVVNNRLSFLWDGKEETLWLFNKVLDLTQRDYVLEGYVNKLTPLSMFSIVPNKLFFKIGSKEIVPQYPFFVFRRK